MKMKKKIKMLTACVLVLSFLSTLCACTGTGSGTIEKQIDKTAKSLQETGETKHLLEDEDLLPAGNSSGDWIAMTLAFSGREDAYADYLERLEEYVGRTCETEGYLHRVKATEYHRIALTMLALGGDPSRVEYERKTYDLIADGTYRFHAGSPGLQGTNGLIYALLALDAMDYEIPEDAVYTRADLVEELLAYQNEDGGISLDSSMGSDVDITAMALQALAPYQEQPKVKEAVEKALVWLAGNMTENGTFVYYGDENTESCAQVLLALCALGIDPEESEPFTAGENTVLDGMNRFRLENGLYKHVESDSDFDYMSTYQALLALEAVETLRTEGRWIFDFEGYTAPKSK